VQAAQLAHRYLTQRKLPDSAIDLVDEACAAVRVARDSQPEAIDVLQRTRTQLDIEIHALEREHEKAKNDTDISDRLDAARTARRKVDDELDPLEAEYNALKSRADDIQAVREKIESLRNKADRAERENDIATASDIRYYSVPDQLAKLEKLEALKKSEDASRGSILGSDEVNAEAIAEIVSRWTGIPASSLKQSEREKLLKMEKIISREVIGQPQAVKAVANAIRLSRSGLSNPNRRECTALVPGGI
jgi:ATP-dependent Clp protease ATP-binding subunit ClpA